MTKEEVLEPAEGDSALGWSSFYQPSVIHQVASAPMPSDCDFFFFDPSETQCKELLVDPSTTIPELFAVIRQWVPQVQRNIDLIGNEILKRGCGVNDRDGLTDMSLLHYCCKAGAPGIGDAKTSAGFARQLLALGADPRLRSRWTNMRAVHYAAYFDVPQLIRVVLQASQPGEVDATCSDFDFGTALHIAASNLCISSVKCLLELGANPAFRNVKGQCPADVVPDPLDMPLEMADAVSVAKELWTLLSQALPRPSSPLSLTLQAQTLPVLSDKARIQLATMGIRLGGRVMIAGQKVGSLRFCGSTEFSGGLWAGVELDKPEGKNDGSVAGVQYFTCRLKHGVLTRSLSSSSSSLDSRHAAGARPRPLLRQRLPARQRRERAPLNHRSAPSPGLHLPSDTTAGLRSRTTSAISSVCGGPVVRLGERVLVVGQRMGVIKFCGKTSFAPGLWLGIELDKPSGKNDGSVGGVNYFSCPPKHGVFAPPSHVQRIHGSVDCLSELSSSRLSHPFSETIRRSSSTSSAIATSKETNRRPATRSRSNPPRRRWSTLSGSVGGVPRSAAGCSPSDGQVRLHVGMHVLLSSANDMALIRYLGVADFAPGLWLGLELRSPKGKNDGSVGARRYFTCQPGHGVLVRPSRVTYRGINGSRLVNEGS
ncbi:CAP-Gly domain-containing linker protein 4 isoform 2-T3 [Spinachia spinachia]